MSTLFSMPRVKSHQPLAGFGVVAVELLLRPERFLRALVRFRPDAKPLLLIWIVGVSASLANLSSRITVMNTMGLEIPTFFTQWVKVWPLVIAGGLVAGPVAWIFHGWWYRVRLRFSGAPPDQISHNAARLVWLYATAVWAVPAVAVDLMATPLHTDLQAAITKDFFGLTVLAMCCWACYVSYRGAVSCFPVKRGPARWWFLILPLAVYGCQIAVFMGLPAVRDALLVR